MLIELRLDKMAVTPPNSLTLTCLHSTNDQADARSREFDVQVFGSGQYAIRIWLKPGTVGRFQYQQCTDVIRAVQPADAVLTQWYGRRRAGAPGQEFTKCGAGVIADRNSSS